MLKYRYNLIDLSILASSKIFLTLLVFGSITYFAWCSNFLINSLGQGLSPTVINKMHRIPKVLYLFRFPRSDTEKKSQRGKKINKDIILHILKPQMICIIYLLLFFFSVKANIYFERLTNAYWQQVSQTLKCYIKNIFKLPISRLFTVLDLACPLRRRENLVLVLICSRTSQSNSLALQFPASVLPFDEAAANWELNPNHRHFCQGLWLSWHSKETLCQLQHVFS